MSSASFKELAGMFEEYDRIFSTIYCITGALGIFLNLTLIILIILRSPPSLRVYRVLLMNVAITDLIFAFTSFFGQVRIIPNKWAFAYISLGPARLLGPKIAYLTYSIQLHSIFYTFLSFPLSFGFRYQFEQNREYYVLVKPMPSVKRVIFTCLGLWSLALAQHILFDLSESDPLMIREYLHQNKPEYNLTGYVISGNHMIHEPLTSITLATIILPMFPIYGIVIYFRQKVLHFLDDHSSSTQQLSESTIRGHRRLIKALTLQAALPVLFFFPPIIIYDLYHLEVIHWTIIEYLVYTLFSFFPVFSPLVTMYFIRAYRVAVERLLRCSGIALQTNHSQYLTSFVTLSNARDPR